MTIMEASQQTQLFSQAMRECDQLLAAYPGRQPLVSIRRQLEYLLAVVQGGADGSRLKEIVIGPMTAREIEPMSATAAEVFYKVAAEVRSMQQG